MTDSKLKLKISHVESNSNLLGPYNRFIIWVHGCCFDCEGCVAVNTRFGAYKEILIEDLADEIIKSSCEGVTISGGEPFLQAQELLILLQKIKKVRDVGVIVYSGFTLSEIKNDSSKSPLLNEIDILIDGRYEKNLDDGRAYVGSSNQVINYLTERYKNAGAKYYSESKRKAEIKFTSSQAILIGVPSREVLNLWKSLKNKISGAAADCQ